jgi:hypothetical protein
MRHQPGFQVTYLMVTKTLGCRIKSEQGVGRFRRVPRSRERPEERPNRSVAREILDASESNLRNRAIRRGEDPQRDQSCLHRPVGVLVWLLSDACLPKRGC